MEDLQRLVVQLRSLVYATKGSARRAPFVAFWAFLYVHFEVELAMFCRRARRRVAGCLSLGHRSSAQAVAIIYLACCIFLFLCNTLVTYSVRRA